MSIIKAISTSVSIGKQLRHLDGYGGFWKFSEVSQSCNMLQLGVERCCSVCPICSYVLTILSGNTLNACDDESSSTVANIAVSLVLK